MQFHLTLPLGAARSFGNRQREFAIRIGGLRIQTAAPVGRAEPGLQFGIVVPDVVTVGNLAHLDLVEGDVAYRHFRSGRQAAKVEDHHDGLPFYSHAHAFLLVTIVLESGQLQAVVIEELDAARVGVGGHLGGCKTVGAGIELSVEGILLGRVDGDVGVQFYLTLPLGAARSFGNRQREFAIRIGGLRIQTAAPVGRAEPGFQFNGGIGPEFLAVDNHNVVAVFGILRFVGRQDGAVVDGVVFHHNVGDGNHGPLSVAAKVKDHLHAIGSVDAFQVGEVVNGLAGFDGLAVGEEEHIVGIHGGELEGHARKGLVGIDDDREVVVLVLGEHDGLFGDDVELGLPLVSGSGRQVDGVFGAIQIHFRIGNLGPAGSVIETEGVGTVGRFPKVGIGIVLEAFEYVGGRLGGKEEVPGDVAVVVHQFQRLAGDAEHLEFRIGPEGIVVDVREQGLFREHQVEFVAVVGKGVRGHLGIHLGHIVLGSVTLLLHERRHRDILVHIDAAILTGEESIGAVTGEAHHTLIHAEGFLILGACRPPLETVGSGGAAAHVTFGIAVDVPELGVLNCGATGQESDELVKAGDGVVNVEGLFHVVGGDTGGVHDLHAHLVITGRGEDALEAVLGPALSEFAVLVLEQPDRDDRFGVHGEGNLVNLLVHRNNGLECGCGLGGLGL